MLGRRVRESHPPLSRPFTLISMGKLFPLYAFLALHGAFRNLTPALKQEQTVLYIFSSGEEL